MTRSSSTRTIDDVAGLLRSGDLTCAELIEHALAMSSALDERHGAFLNRFDSHAREAARTADDALRSGAEPGPLHGMPLGVKDLISTVEGPTTAQSLVHDPRVLTGDAPVVARLRDAGMVVLGKTTTMEFGIGRHDPDKPFPLPRNPWNTDYCTGGSSSGSASAVAAGAVLGALGTDTGGSIRIPATFCGVSGLKPTYGLVPRSGVVPYVYSLDHVGPTARSARDCALMLGVIAGHDPDDLTSVDQPIDDYTALFNTDLSDLRIGVDALTRHAGTVDPAVPAAFDAALAVLADLGAELVDVELPYYEESIEVYMVTALGESLAYHAHDLERRWDDHFASTRSTIGSGVFYTAADYVQAQRVRTVTQRALGREFDDVDLIVTPTTSIAAPRLDEIEQYFTLQGQRSVHTLYCNVVGNPALTVPMGFNADGLPLGLQIAGNSFDDALVLRAGDTYQQITDWHLQSPPLLAGQRV